MDMIEVEDNDGLLYTAREIAEGITIKEEDENDVTTDSGVSSDEAFDPDSQSDFDDNIDGDEDIKDENMWFHYCTIYYIHSFIIVLLV